MKKLLIMLSVALMLVLFSSITLAENSIILETMVNGETDWDDESGDLSGYFLGYTNNSDTFGFGIEVAISGETDYDGFLYDFLFSNIYGAFNVVTSDQFSMAITIGQITLNESDDEVDLEAFPLVSIQLGAKFSYDFSDLFGIDFGFGYGISNSGEDYGEPYDSVAARSYNLKLVFSPSESFDITAGYRVYAFTAEDSVDEYDISYTTMTIGAAFNF